MRHPEGQRCEHHRLLGPAAGRATAQGDAAGQRPEHDKARGAAGARHEQGHATSIADVQTARAAQDSSGATSTTRACSSFTRCACATADVDFSQKLVTTCPPSGNADPSSR